MQNNIQAKIFLSGERGCTETALHRSLQTFCSESYQHEHKLPFGSLHLLNDETLAAGQSQRYLLTNNYIVVVLPIVGALRISSGLIDHEIEAGQVVALDTNIGDEIELTNPYEDQLINYVQLWIQHPGNHLGKCLINDFDLEANRNQQTKLFTDSTGNGEDYIQVTIGKYGGREEYCHQLSSPENGLFVFVIQGAFEVQNRLLESRDGLALWNMAELEMEALSEEAIVLTIEVPLKTVE